MYFFINASNWKYEERHPYNLPRATLSMPMDFKTTQWTEYLQVLAAVLCDLYTEVPGIYGHAQFNRLTWSRWVDSIRTHMNFPERAAGLNPTINGAWISYMLENAQRKDNIRKPDPNVASTGDRAGDGWTGPVIEEVIEGQPPSYLPPTPKEHGHLHLSSRRLRRFAIRRSSWRSETACSR